MRILHNFLDGCTGLWWTALTFYLIAAAGVFKDRKFYGLDSAKKFFREISPIRMYKSGVASGDFLTCLFYRGSVLFAAVGILNLIASHIFAVDQIGAFYEKAEYTRNYEITLEVKDQPIFAIATIQRKDEIYEIKRIDLPYRRTAEIGSGQDYDPKDDLGISVGNEGTYCTIQLGKPADENSHKKLLEYELPETGEFCASKNSDVFHFQRCRYVQNIDKTNMIYFQNECEADVFGYTMCSVCRDLYY